MDTCANNIGVSWIHEKNNGPRLGGMLISNMKAGEEKVSFTLSYDRTLEIANIFFRLFLFHGPMVNITILDILKENLI